MNQLLHSLLAARLLACTVTPAQAQPYPTKPLRMSLTFAPCGGAPGPSAQLSGSGTTSKTAVVNREIVVPCCRATLRAIDRAFK